MNAENVGDLNPMQKKIPLYLEVSYWISVCVGFFASYIVAVVLINARPIELYFVTNAMITFLLLGSGIRALWCLYKGNERGEFSTLLPIVFGLSAVTCVHVYTMINSINVGTAISPAAGTLTGVLIVLIIRLVIRFRFLLTLVKETKKNAKIIEKLSL